MTSPKTYIGTKIVQAEPQEKDGVKGYRIVYSDGYVSWSPQQIFVTHYREITTEEETLIAAPLFQGGITKRVDPIESDQYKRVMVIIEDLVPAFTDAHREDLKETRRSVMHRFYQRLIDEKIVISTLSN